jgi:ACT domain-containing protein
MSTPISTSAIITVVGNDRVGIIARVSGFLAERNVNIEDITQSILSGTFVMMMKVDLSATAVPLPSLKRDLAALGGTMEVSISIWNEDVFTAMHRI